MVLNSIRSYRTKFSNDFGELILCYDDKNCWRKNIYPIINQTEKRLEQKVV